MTDKQDKENKETQKEEQGTEPNKSPKKAAKKTKKQAEETPKSLDKSPKTDDTKEKVKKEDQGTEPNKSPKKAAKKSKKQAEETPKSPDKSPKTDDNDKKEKVKKEEKQKHPLLIRYEKEIAESYEVLLNAATADDGTDGWTKVKQNKKISIAKKGVEGSPIKRMRGRATIEAPAETIYNWMTGIEKLPEVDALYRDGFIIEELDGDHGIVLSLYTAGVPLIAEREFLFLESRTTTEDGVYMITAFSVERDDVPNPYFKSAVRAITINSGSYIKRIDDEHAWVAYVVQIDPKGWIPTFVVNKVAETAPLIIAGLEKAINKKKQKQLEEQAKEGGTVDPSAVVSTKEKVKKRGFKQKKRYLRHKVQKKTALR